MYLLLYFCSFSVFLCSITSARPPTNNSERLEFIQLIEYSGYTGESHHVITEDGYNLRIDRISTSPLSSEASKKPVVFLQHGIIGSSELFVLWEHNNSLAYLLADAGYDVWLGNSRGNTNSRSHKTLSPNSSAFWNFNLNDLATKDLPAMIDYVLNVTQQETLTYIGHSCGTTISYILLSEKPEYNDKVNLVVSLAPVALWTPSTISLSSFDYSAEVFPASKSTSSYCGFLNEAICLWVVNNFLGHPSVPFSDEDVKYVAQYIPAGTSLQIFNHFRQNINSGKFAKYDYGNPEKNTEKYGQEESPLYDTTKITAPVALFWTHDDPLSPKDSIDKLAATLPHVVTSQQVQSAKFSHIDYFFHAKAKELFCDRILDLISQYTS